MAYTFNGTTKIISLTGGTISFDVVDLYSRWKDWTAEADNSKFPQALSVVGGDPIDDTNNITPYFFLENGWKIRPQEATHVLTVNGVILVTGGGSPFVATVGSYNVSIRSIVPLRAESVISGGGAAVDFNDLMDGQTVDGSTVRQLLKGFGALLLGKVSGAGTGTEVFRAHDDSKVRVTVTVNEAGNRTAVTLDLD